MDPLHHIVLGRSMQDSCQSASRLRYTQVIKIEAVQSATRELSDQSASSFGHASVSGHFADVRKDVLWASRESGQGTSQSRTHFLPATQERSARCSSVVKLTCQAYHFHYTSARSKRGKAMPQRISSSPTSLPRDSALRRCTSVCRSATD